jgi:xanthine phosphoribosyltransferase
MGAFFIFGIIFSQYYRFRGSVFMQSLEERIRKDGVVKDSAVLKVDSFLNHQMDIALFSEIGKEFYRLFAADQITKIITIEASGIGIACIAAQYFNVPVVFAKKSKTSNLTGEVYKGQIYSFTHQCFNEIYIKKSYISKEDKILIIDDFLAKGSALEGLIQIVNEAGAKLAGAGIVIEKGFQGGGDLIRSKGVRVESLAIIERMEGGNIVFRH